MTIPSPRSSSAELLRAWPASTLAVWVAAWRAQLVSPDDVLHLLHDYAQVHELDAATDTGVIGDGGLDLLRLVADAPQRAVCLPGPGDPQGLPPGALTAEVLGAGEVLVLGRSDGPPLTITARGTAERYRWSVGVLRSSPGVDSVSVESMGCDRGLGELEYELREAVGVATSVLGGLSGPRTGPVDLRDALAARVQVRTVQLPPHNRPRIDRMLGSAAQIEAIVDLYGGDLGATATQLAVADEQVRRLTALTRAVRSGAMNALLREY